MPPSGCTCQPTPTSSPPCLTNTNRDTKHPPLSYTSTTCQQLASGNLWDLSTLSGLRTGPQSRGQTHPCRPSLQCMARGSRSLQFGICLAYANWALLYARYMPALCQQHTYAGFMPIFYARNMPLWHLKFDVLGPKSAYAWYMPNFMPTWHMPMGVEQAYAWHMPIVSIVDLSGYAPPCCGLAYARHMQLGFIRGPPTFRRCLTLGRI